MSPKKKKRPAFTAGLFLFIFIAGFAAAYLYKNFESGRPSEDLPYDVPEEISGNTEVAPKVQSYEAMAVIVIDDLGYDLSKVQEIADIGLPITVAVIPYLPDSKKSAIMAGERGLEVIVHMPMEPTNVAENDPGEYALLVGMKHKDIMDRVSGAFAEVPGAVGLNNHMGSRFTEDREGMESAISVVKDRGLFFLDSKTSPKSVAYSTASSLGVRAVERSVFLDNEQDEEHIKAQLDRLVELAKKRKIAVAIGHPYKETIKVLKENASELESRGVKLVNLSDIVK